MWLSGESGIGDSLAIAIKHIHLLTSITIENKHIQINAHIQALYILLLTSKNKLQV